MQRGTATVINELGMPARRQDRHHQRLQGRLVHRLFARPRGRRLGRLRYARATWAKAKPAGASPRRFSATSCAKRCATWRPRRSEFRPASVWCGSITRPGCCRARKPRTTILEAFTPGTEPTREVSLLAVRVRRHRPDRPARAVGPHRACDREPIQAPARRATVRGFGRAVLSYRVGSSFASRALNAYWLLSRQSRRSPMRAEILALAEQINSAVALLRRRL